jgi:hypothetical protein
MLRDMDRYDTNNYDKDSKLFSTVNAKVVGNMKDECADKHAIEFVGLQARIYSIFLVKNENQK